MILVIVILLGVWIILTLLIVSLCFVARLGDLQQNRSDPPLPREAHRHPGSEGMSQRQKRPVSRTRLDADARARGALRGGSIPRQ
jgi:hypothetical protein